MKKLNEIEHKVLKEYLSNNEAIETIRLKLKPLNNELKRLTQVNQYIEENGELPKNNGYCEEDIPF